MAQGLKLGIIGMSEGNGHPYSWSAIFNGYDKKNMESCPFPVIPEYLAEQKFPDNGLSHLGTVTHVWTQDETISEHIARAALIPNVAKEMKEMIGLVDAVLLARDDAENHYEMSLPFLKAGIPLFIDKPLALTLADAARIFSAQLYEGQVFTCSSFRYASELSLNNEDRALLGTICHVEGSIMKKWNKYAVHLLEPFISQLPDRGKLRKVNSFYKNSIASAFIEWENVSGYIKTTGQTPTPIEYKYYGQKGSITKKFTNPFACFKTSLEKFIDVIGNKYENISRDETMEIVAIIEKGNL